MYKRQDTKVTKARQAEKDIKGNEIFIQLHCDDHLLFEASVRLLVYDQFQEKLSSKYRYRPTKECSDRSEQHTPNPGWTRQRQKASATATNEQGCNNASTSKRTC